LQGWFLISMGFLSPPLFSSTSAWPRTGLAATQALALVVAEVDVGRLEPRVEWLNGTDSHGCPLESNDSPIEFVYRRRSWFFLRISLALSIM
jgi:hypothetical protein